MLSREHSVHFWGEPGSFGAEQQHIPRCEVGIAVGAGALGGNRPDGAPLHGGVKRRKIRVAGHVGKVAVV